jgi:colanic acid/amylovoran biosynthesis glycosyltransferase
MKIGMLVTSFPVAAQPFILNQITGLLDQGVDVEIVARNDTRNEPYHVDFDHYKLVDRTYYLNEPSTTSERIKYIWFHRSRLSGVGLRRIICSLNILKYGCDALSLRLLVILLQLYDRAWDIIHVQYGVNGYIGRFLRDIGVARKFVLQIRGSVFATTNPKAGCKRLFVSADFVLTISQALYDLVISKGACPARTKILYTGIRLGRFPFNENWTLETTPLKLLSVGRLVPVKGHSVLIQALPKLVDSGIDVSYTIVGGGPLKQDLLKLARQQGVTDRLQIVDLLPQEELVDLYHSHHFLIHPSIVLPDGCFEGMGTAITEAQACGLPVIASDHGGMLDTVKDGETGFLFATGKTDSLSDQICHLIKDIAVLSSVQKNARVMIEHHHNSDEQASCLYSLYCNLLEVNRNGGHQ